MTRKTKSKTFFIKSLLIFFILFSSCLFLFLIWWWRVTKPILLQDTEKLIFVVPKGYGVDLIATALKEQGFIRNELAFKIMVAKEGIAQDLQAGDFYLTRGMNLYEIAQTLTHGTVDIWVTIPEGLRREEIASILVETFGERGIDFDTEVFLNESENLEGYLFPDTYLIPKTASSSQVVQILRDTFDQKVPDSTKLEANKLGLSFSQVMILASIVEREAKHQQDRALVAGILLKRFENDWPLQADATLQYALGVRACQGKKSQCDWWPIVKDTKFESPYNTYLYPGLPPTPICNPSLEAIEAVLNPKKSQYWYYLSDSSGKMHYALTIEEHEENIEEYLK